MQLKLLMNDTRAVFMIWMYGSDEFGSGAVHILYSVLERE